MTLRYYYRDNDGDVVEMTNPRRVRRTDTEASTQGEEGAVGTWDLEVDDPDGTFNIRGYRLVYAQEDEAIADDQHGVIGVWYTGDRYVTRMARNSPAKRTEASRTWRLSLHDLNTRLTWRLNIGNDCDRPVEDDVDRVAWLMSTNEMSFVDNDTTYIDSSDGFEMDATPYSGQTLMDVIDDCAQTSGRNYGLLWEYSGDDDDPIAIKLWYKQAGSDEYTSTKALNNRLEEQVGDVHAPSLDAELNRSPSRVAWGVNQLFDGGSTYQTRQITADRFGKVDVTGRGENVKTEAKAIARANRYLNTVSNQETDRITVSTLVALADVNSILPFHRLAVHFEHLPGYGELDEYDEPEYIYMRVVERTVRDRFSDAYELGLTLQGDAIDDLTVPGPEYDTSIRAFLIDVSGPYDGYPTGDLLWGKRGDDIGWPPEILTNGPFAFVASDSGSPPWYGIEVTADGILQSVKMVASHIGVAIGANSPYSVTYTLYRNEDDIGIYSEIVVADGASSVGANPVVTIAVSDVAVTAGDVIHAKLGCSPVWMEMFRSPLGINPGVGWNRIEIKGMDIT